LTSPTPVPAANAADANSTSDATSAPEEMIPAGNINFQGVDVSQVLEVYAKLSGAPCCAPACPPPRLS